MNRAHCPLSHESGLWDVFHAGLRGSPAGLSPKAAIAVTHCLVHTSLTFLFSQLSHSVSTFYLRGIPFQINYQHWALDSGQAVEMTISWVCSHWKQQAVLPCASKRAPFVAATLRHTPVPLTLEGVNCSLLLFPDVCCCYLTQSFCVLFQTISP